ncbi:unnamed protein product [Polarella glacialis]|uniref:AP2/ERF domain-containing protein n=1 Tax=Polarella glacialis TaxID=89957 RepID=A0A813FP75_POLGL|nr:unnamed protein product [Polarella glacialis]
MLLHFNFGRALTSFHGELRTAVSQAERTGPGRRRGGQSCHTSRFRGVAWDGSTGRWQVTITDRSKHKQLWLGYFDDDATAASVYDCAAMRIHGSGAKLNFPGRAPTQLDEGIVEARFEALSQQKSSIYKGVSWNRSTGNWRAFMKLAGVSKHIGYFHSEVEAATAFDLAFRKSLPCRSFLLQTVNFLNDEDYFFEDSWQQEPIPEHRWSRFRGVSRGSQTQNFQAKIGTRHLGTYSSEIDAARAFDCASIASAGRTNFHPATYADPHEMESSQTRLPRRANQNQLVECPALPLQSWISAHCQAQIEENCGPATTVLSRLKADVGMVSESEFQAQRLLWQEFLKAEKRKLEDKLSHASQWRFQDEELVKIRSWPNNGMTFATLRHEPDHCELVRAKEMLQTKPGASFANRKLKPRTRLKSQLVRHLDSVVGSFEGDHAKGQSWLLDKFVGNEAQSRMLIDVILLESCRRSSLSLCPEQVLPAGSPVPGVADYVLRRGSVAVAVVEAKRCLPFAAGCSNDASISLLTSATAQTLALLAGLCPDADLAAGTQQRPWGIVSDVRHWILVDLPSEGPPVLQCWPDGSAMLQLSGPAELGLLLDCLSKLFA